MIEKRKELGSVSPKIKLFYENNLIDNIGILISIDGGGAGRGHKEQDLGQYNMNDDVFGVCAGAALYKREALESISYKNEFFDNSFFVYYEDLDLAWRLRLNKWEAITCPEAVVLHVHSATAGSNSPFASYYMNRNRYFIIFKNLPIRYLIFTLILTPYRYLKLINSMFFKKSGSSYKLKKNSGSLKPFIIVFKGLGSLLWNIPSLMIKRYHIQHNKKVLVKEVGEWFIKYKVNGNDLIYK
jgi:hypothetical protein